MNNDPSVFYYQLLAINEEAFANNFFTVSYHALSGAFYCALALNDKEKCAEVEKLVSDQQEKMKVYFARDGDLQDGYSDEPMELTLYSSLHYITNPRQNSF